MERGRIPNSTRTSRIGKKCCPPSRYGFPHPLGVPDQQVMKDRHVIPSKSDWLMGCRDTALLIIKVV